MNGSLYFYRNLLGLARHFEAVYSLDQLGWGLSSRPEFDRVVPADGKSENDDTCPIQASENFFVESLEAWRKANSIERMNLCGHSMGGYLGVAYAERYPQHVDRLILLSPVGVPEEDPEKDPLARPDIPLRFKVLFNTFRYLWSRGTTPGSFARSIPQSQARNMIDKYVEGRLPQVTCSNERQLLGDYLFHSAMLPGSGEFSLNRILKPGAYARKPTVSRIPNLAVSHVSFVYGQYDWMDCSGGLGVQRRCQDMHQAGEKVRKWTYSAFQRQGICCKLRTGRKPIRRLCSLRGESLRKAHTFLDDLPRALTRESSSKVRDFALPSRRSAPVT